MFPMNIQDLMKRYGFSSPQGMRKFARKHLAALNEDGEHARQTDAGWEFDETAVRRMDALRDIQPVIVEASPREKELEEQVESLRTALLLAQQELIAAQKKLLETGGKLIAANADAARKAQEHEKETISLRGELDRERERNAALLSRGLWARIMNRE